MATRGSRNNVLAGAFVIASLILGVAVILVLSNISEWFIPRNTYFVRFSLTDGAEGLRNGSLVKVGGEPVGRVTGWQFERDPGTGSPTAVLVEVSVRADLKLYEDALPLLTLPLLGSNSSINIPIPGTGNLPPDQVHNGDARLQPGETLSGRVAPPSFLAQAGFGPDQAAQIQSIIARADRVSASIEQQWEPKVRATLADVQSVADDARARWPEWRDRVSAVLTAVQNGADRLGGIADAVRAGIDDARQMITANRARIDSALEHIESLARKADTEGWEQIRVALDKGRAATTDFADAAERVSALIKESAPQLRTVVANARLASDQLKLTSAEVRAAPWKILSPPSGRKSLENEALYDAARAYSTAVSDLRAAAASLESVAAAGGAPGVPAQDAVALVDDLNRAFQKYKDAEQNFLTKLTTPPK